MASVTEEQNYFELNLNNHTWLVAALLDQSARDCEKKVP